jgi:hypothetical protein
MPGKYFRTYSLLIALVVAAIDMCAVTAQLPLPLPPPPLPHPKMHVALFELQAAHKELKESRDRFGGHRARAILATDEAIVTLKLMLAIKGDFHLAGRNADFYKQYKDFPRLRQALEDLQVARDELRESKDFGILKARGIRDIDRAIEQIEIVLKHVP